MTTGAAATDSGGNEMQTFDPMLIVTGADAIDVFLLAMFVGMVWLLALLPHERQGA